MKNFAFLAGLSRRVSLLRRDQRGVSAIEFAMLLPLMVVLYLGCVEVSQAVAIQRKVTLTARTIADLASQVTTINNTDMTNMLSAAASVVAPFSSSEVKVTVTAVSVDAKGVAKVTWSDTLNGTKHAEGTVVTLPAALNVANSNVIWSEVRYDYVPTIGYVLTGTVNLFDQIYMRPRLADSVTRTNS